MSTQQQRTATRKVENFVRRAFHATHNAPGRLRRIALYLWVAGEPAREIQPWEFAEDENPNEPLLCSEIEGRSIDYAEDWPGSCRFFCKAYFGTSEHDERGTLESDHWHITGTRRADPGGEEDWSGSEPPSKAGITAQVMRYNDSILGKAFGAIASTQQAQSRTIGDLTTMNQNLMRGYLEFLTATQDMADRTTERKVRIEQVQAQTGREKEAWELFTILFPSVANIAARHVGMPLQLPEKAAPLVEMLKRTFGTLKPEQVRGLMAANVLSPEQVVGISEIFNTLEQLAKQDEIARAMVRSDDGKPKH